MRWGAGLRQAGKGKGTGGLGGIGHSLQAEGAGGVSILPAPRVHVVKPFFIGSCVAPDGASVSRVRKEATGKDRRQRPSIKPLAQPAADHDRIAWAANGPGTWPLRGYE